MKNLRVITYLDKINKKFTVLRDTCKKYNINLEICGLGIQYRKKINIKHKWIKSYFDSNKLTETEKDNTYLIFLDGHDTKVVNDMNEDDLIKKFKSYNCDILYTCQRRRHHIIEGLDLQFTNKEKNQFFRYNITMNNDEYTKFFKLDENTCLNCGFMMGLYSKIESYINYMNLTYNDLKKNDELFLFLEQNHRNVCGDQLLVHYLFHNKKLSAYKFGVDSQKLIYSYVKASKNNESCPFKRTNDGASNRLGDILNGKR